MGGIVAMSGRDVTIIDGTVLTALADADAVKLEFSNAIGDMKMSKDGNAIYSMKYSGLVVKVSIKLLRGSADDVELNSKLQDFIADPASFELMVGSFIKRIGDGKGNIVSDVYQLAGGVFNMVPGAKENTDGDLEQSTIEYVMLFRNNIRMIQ